MNANKISLNGKILIDLTADTAVEEDVAVGKTFHKADGTVGIGTAESMEFNIAYGDTPPEDTSKLWVKTTAPTGVIVSGTKEFGGGAQDENLEAVTVNHYAMRRAATAKVDDRIYFLGGGNQNENNVFNTISYFDTVSEVATTLSVTLPKAIARSGCASYGKNIFVFGGATRASYNAAYYISDIYVFNTESETVSTLETTYTYNNNGIADITCVAVGSIIYLLGGSSSTDIKYISPFNAETMKFVTVSEKPAIYLPCEVSNASAAIVGTKIYIFNGRKSNSVYGNNIVCFDLEAYTVTMLDVTLPEKHSDTRACAVGDKIYIFGGYLNLSTNNPTQHIFCFDTTTNEIVLNESFQLSTPMYGMACFLKENVIYIVFDNVLNKYYPPVGMMSLENGKIQVLTSLDKNIFNLINANNIKIETGVDKVFKGNANNEGEEVDAALYKNGEWVTI